MAWGRLNAATSWGVRVAPYCCKQVEITDLVSGMTAAQLADVFVGVHGANLANGWLMRPGSSMLEVQPYGFDAHVPHLQDPLFNAEVRWRSSSRTCQGHRIQEVCQFAVLLAARHPAW